MDIIGIISNHKIKIISSLTGATVISAGSTIPYLTQKNSDATELPVEGEKPESYPAPLIKTSSTVKKSPSKPNPTTNTASKLMNLKSEKGELLRNVGDKISHYKNMIKDLQDIGKLEEELNKCFSKEEVNNDVTEGEKKQLKDSYSAVKGDIEKYEKLKQKITTGELKDAESDADKDSADEERYSAFKNKFDKINQEYKGIVDKKSGEALQTSFLNIKSKLTATNQQCSFKDIIKINDNLGRANSLR